MKLTKKEEAEVIKVYDTWLHSYLNGDVKTYDSYFDDQYHFIGSTDNEDFLNRKDTTGFFKKTADQLAGKVEIRNNIRTIEKFNELIFVTERFDAYFLIESEWSYYGKFRFTSALQKKKEGWRFIYQHFSTPDSKAQEGETIGTEQIAAENLMLREAVKRRTTELEQKNRELAIEAATERVRTQAMAMQHPDDLDRVNKEILNQLNLLQIPGLTGVTFYLVNENGWVNAWDFSSPGNMGNQNSYSLQFDFKKYEMMGEPFQILLQTDLNYFVADYPLEKLKKAVYELEEINPAVASVFREALAGGALTHQWTACARISNGLLGVDLVSPPSGDTKTIVLKMAAAFNQAYTRFLDLKKAEAQAKEAQIETALERTRTQSMLMQQSDEIINISAVFHQQLLQLNIPSEFSYVWLPDEQKNNHQFWASWEEDEKGNKIIKSKQVTYPLDKSESYTAACYAAWTNPDKTHIQFIPPADVPAFFNVWQELLDGAKNLKARFFPQGIYYAEAYMRYGCFGINIRRELSPGEKEVLKKFSIEFERAYTRFLDLKKAEAQAREAQIEAALERVRSRTMAMHSSSELIETAELLFDQLNQLGAESQGVAFAICDKESIMVEKWTSIGVFSVPYTFEAGEQRMYEAWKNQTEIYEEVYEGERLRKYYELFMEIPEFKQGIQKFIDSGYSLPEWQKNHAVPFKYGYLLLITSKPFEKTYIFTRFAKVFEQTYTRFLDLQKAEEQARESRIEAALEKVRSRTMGMQRSDELQDAAMLLFQQIQSLGMPPFACGFNIWDDDRKAATAWMRSIGSLQPPFKTDSSRDIYLPIYEAAQRGESLFVIEQSGKELEVHYQYLATIPTFRDIIMEDWKRSGVSVPTFQIIHCAYFTHGYLMFISFEPVPAYYDIFKRFAKVFEQTYTRFLDLQKAEAQAREAQIEAALERVRAQSMAMHKSDELVQVVRLLNKEIAGLGIATSSSQIAVDFEPEEGFNQWIAVEGQDYLEKFHVTFVGQLAKNIVAKRLLQAKANKVDFYSEKYSKKEKDQHFRLLFKYTDYQRLPEESKKRVYGVPGMIRANVLSKNSVLMFVRWDLIDFTMEEEEIFKRFGTVFDQAYTRFLDLQKAEAQAREAQIVAALEKVRSRSLAMHSTNELGEVVTVIVEKLTELGVVLDANGVVLCTYFEDSKNVLHWIASPDFSFTGSYLLPYFDHIIFNDAWNSKESGDAYFSKNYSVEEKNSFWEFAFEHSDYRYFPDDFKQWVFQNDKHTLSFAWQKNSAILIPSHTGVVPTEDEAAILKRFAKVFEQAYTRFLDLQRAETQAREAQIEAALERVRSKAMSMHSSEDLAAAIRVFYLEMKGLSVTPRRLGVGLVSRKNRIAEISSMNTTEQGETIEVLGKLEMTGHPVLDGIYDHWLVQKEYHPILRGNEIREYYSLIRPHIAYPDYPTDAVQFGYFFPFTEGSIYAWTEQELLEDELKIYRKFTSVLSLTYKRYKDLKDAEANALEAVRRASLDRVRAEIASMRTVDDLQRITPIIWHELTMLGVPFVRCGVFIIDESAEHIQVHLSSPDGNALGALDLPFDSSELTLNSVNHWRQGIIFKTHWDKQEFLNFMQSMIKLGQVSNQETYQGAAQPPESLHLHFVPFKQGMLYVGNTSPLEKEALELVKSLAESFSIAYARYEDFRQLELAKNQIEKTFTELKAAQAQLIQAEKMASLGELTAGIAHEIQNPLNFVNNFSEVSAELVDEMKEELEDSRRQYAAGSRQLGEEKLNTAKEIAGDISQNLEKINHHGKRAADIVKGMLQHSRTSSGQKEPTDINALADEYLRLAYHGLRAKDKSFNADFKTEFDESLPKINVIPQDIGRVLLNLINNAFYAVDKRAKSFDPLTPEGGTKNDQIKYVPTVTISTTFLNPPSGGRGVRITVKDNGPGIPPHIVDKIFQPFFTTKPTGQGTGLGLSLAYDIVKAHGGELKVETKEGEGTEFLILLPIN